MQKVNLKPIIQPKLKIGQPNDKFEQEADRVADHVLQMPQSPPPIQRKCEHCEEEQLQMKPLISTISPNIQKKEEELQMKGLGNDTASHSNLQSSLQQSKGGGAPLDSSTQLQMSTGIGADFSKVKIHTNSNAIQMNRSLNAKAFTNGNDIYFNQGEYSPNNSKGKKLLAHELTHTIQQGKPSSLSPTKHDRIIQREPLDGSVEESEDQFCFMVHVGTDIDGGSKGGTCQTFEEGTELDLFSPIIYEGDVFQIEVENLASPPISWELPSELEMIQNIDKTTVMLRVRGAGISERKIKLIARTASSEPDVSALINIGELKSKADARNPKMVKNKHDREEAKMERQSKRQTFKNGKKQLNKDFRQLDREDKRENRKTFKGNKAKLRSARKGERKELREEKQELRKEKRTLNDASSCSFDYQSMITTALNRAIAVSSAAVSRLQKGTTDSNVASNLSSIMKWSIESNSDAENEAVIQKIADVLNVANNNMLLSTNSTFVCGSEKCSDMTGAFVIGGNGRGGQVTLCNKWLLKKVKFGFEGTPEDQQAFALLHEFVHLSGPQGKDETYVHKKGEWNKLSHQRALEMADAYARLAWELGA